jgi:hypothetical protein
MTPAIVALLVAAAPTVMRPTDSADPSIEEQIDELESENAKDRKLAAMSLRRMTRQYTRAADREHGDEMQILEARQGLMVFDDALSRTCIERLAVSNLTGPCADILGMLGTADAAAPLEAQRAREERRRVQRKIDKALAAIRAP